MGRLSTGAVGRSAVALVTLLALAFAVEPAEAAKHQRIVRSPQHIVVCHATGNGGFVTVNVAVDDIITGQGHGSHPRDIIPSFSYTLSDGHTGHYAGQNYDDVGQAIWSNGCARPAPPSGQIQVHVACVDVHANGTYDARFGYVSSAPGDVEIPVGDNNAFSPTPQARGQVTTFTNGTVLGAFTVTGITDQSLTWTVAYGGQTSSDTATASFGVPCSDAPSTDPDVPIGPFVTCVVNHPATGTYDAVFGYHSDNSDPETIPIGDGNNFSPGPANRGQPTTFTHGITADAVTVTGIDDSVALTWTLAWTSTNKAIATSDFQTKCSQPPEPPTNQAVGVFVACVTSHGSTYDASFGYTNENADSVKVPIGAGNSVNPGPDDQGQPDTFAPGFVAVAFTVHGISASTDVTWRVVVDGQVRVATATASFPTQCITAPEKPQDDAGVGKSASPRTVAVGQKVRFKIRVFNNGSMVLRHFDAKDRLAGRRLRVLSVRSTAGRCRTRRLRHSTRVVCAMRTLAPGQAVAINVVAQAVAPGTSEDTATVPDTPTSPSPPTGGRPPAVPPGHDRTPKDNDSTASVTVVRPAPPPPVVTG